MEDVQVIRIADDRLQMRQLTLASEGKPEFVCLPTIHIGNSDFYKFASAQIGKCDAAITEGISHPELNAAIRRTHNLAKGGGNGVSLQSDSVVYETQIFSGDVSPETFDTSWSRIPKIRKGLFWLAKSLVSRLMRTRTFRKWLLSSDSAFDSDPRMYLWIGGQQMTDAILTERNEALFTRCDDMIDDGAHQKIAVVWGAMHIAALVQHLGENHGYSIKDADWITAMAAD